MFNHIDRDEIHDVGADSGVLREGAAQIMSPIMLAILSTSIWPSLIDICLNDGLCWRAHASQGKVPRAKYPSACCAATPHCWGSIERERTESFGKRKRIFGENIGEESPQGCPPRANAIINNIFKLLRSLLDDDSWSFGRYLVFFMSVAFSFNESFFFWEHHT